MTAQGGVGGEGHAVDLRSRDGELWTDQSLVEAVAAETDVLEHLEAVEGVAAERHAVVTGRELEFLVDLGQTVEEDHFHAALTLYPSWIGKTNLQQATYTGLNKGNVLVDKRTYFDVNTQFAAEVSIKLTHRVPAVLAHGRTVVHTAGSVAVVDEGSVETCQGLDLSIQQTQVDVDITPGRGTHHDAALGIG